MVADCNRFILLLENDEKPVLVSPTANAFFPPLSSIFREENLGEGLYLAPLHVHQSLLCNNIWSGATIGLERIIFRYVTGLS